MEADWQWGTNTENADVQDLRLTFVSNLAALEGYSVAISLFTSLLLLF